MEMLDIFNGNAFSKVSLTHALDRIPYVPSYLAGLNIFEPKPIRTISAALEKRENVISLVQTTQRGAPIRQKADEKRDIRDVRTVRIALGDTIHSHELQSIRAFGSPEAMEEVTTEVARRMVSIRRDIDLTLERHRLGAINGLVLDANGDTILDWYSFWGITRRATLRWTFDAAASSGNVRTQCTALTRRMERLSRGAFTPSTRVMALCGDEFFDALIASKEVRETYLNYQAAADLRGASPRAGFIFGGIEWMNYRGTDDNNATTGVAIPSKQARFFPVGGRDIFSHYMSPGEALDDIGTLGKPYYALTLPDRDRNTKVDIEVYTYPLFACNHPDVLETGDIA